MEDYLDLAERLLAKCQSNWNTTSLQVCDEIVHELQVYTQVLAENTQDIITVSGSHHNIVSQDLLVFSRCMGLILVQWENKAIRLESEPVHSTAGRPKKVVNIELVSTLNLEHTHNIISLH